MDLSLEERERWGNFIKAKVRTDQDIKEPILKKYVLVNEQLWRDFCVCVIKNERRGNRNSFVINKLIKRYIIDTKERNRNELSLP